MMPMLPQMGAQAAQAIDPLQAYAQIAQGGGQQPAPEADVLARALEYARQQQGRIGPAPQADPALQGQMLGAQREMELADALMGQGYVANSGPLGALAQVLSAWQGKRQGKKAEGSLADALAKEAEYQQQAQQYEGRRKAFDEGPAKIMARAEQAQALGLQGAAAEEFVLTGKMPKAPAPTSKERDFERAQRDPAYAAWLEKQAPKGTNVTVSTVGQSAFDRELGKADAQTYVGWRDNAVQAQRTLEQLGNVEEILALQQTGKVQEAMALAGQYFGTEAGSNLQALKGAIQPIVLSQVKQLGSGNGITDADRNFIEAGMPGFGNDPRANERVMRIMRQAAGANLRLYEEADQHLQANGSLRGFKPTVTPAGMGGGSRGEQAPAEAPAEPAPLTDERRRALLDKY